MDRDALIAYLLEKPGAVEEYPFGEDAAVFKVAGKMFALCMLPADPLRVNLKCDPEWAEILRDGYEAIIPGYHMNKRHWNTVVLDGSVADEELLDLVDHSYELVVAKLPKRMQAELAEEREPLSDLFEELAGRIGGELGLRDAVLAISRIPYGRPSERTAEAVVRERRGTCSTKHLLLAHLIGERWPEHRVSLWHRPYTVTRDLARDRWGEGVADVVPAEGLVDVHTFATVRIDGTDVPLDVTFPIDDWDGRSPLPLHCGSGTDVPAGADPLGSKAELVEEHCDPSVREPFIAALSREGGDQRPPRERLRITPCGPGRAEEIRRLTQEAFRSYDRLDPPSGAVRESLDRVRDDLVRGGGAIAELDGRPIACLRWEVNPDGAFHVRRLAVLPELQGRGIGRKMMGWAEDEARRRGCDAVSVGVRVDLPDNLALYRRLGYEVTAEHRHEGYDRTTWLGMRKELP